MAFRLTTLVRDRLGRVNWGHGKGHPAARVSLPRAHANVSPGVPLGIAGWAATSGSSMKQRRSKVAMKPTVAFLATTTMVTASRRGERCLPVVH